MLDIDTRTRNALLRDMCCLGECWFRVPALSRAVRFCSDNMPASATATMASIRRRITNLLMI